MNNTIQNPLIRIVFAIALGLLLILYPNAAVNTILLITGILLGLPSLYTLLSYAISKERDQRAFPIVETLILLFSLTLIFFPDWYKSVTKLVLGGSLVAIGLYQLIFLLSLKKAIRVKANWLSYLLPLLILVVGVEILTNPFGTTERVTVVIFGSAMLLYGITALLHHIQLRNCN